MSPFDLLGKRDKDRDKEPVPPTEPDRVVHRPKHGPEHDPEAPPAKPQDLRNPSKLATLVSSSARHAHRSSRAA